MTINEMLQLVPEEDRDKEMVFLDIYTGRNAKIGIERVEKEYILCLPEHSQFCKHCPHLEVSNKMDPLVIRS